MLALLAMVSCSPQRQLARLRYRHPELFADTTLHINVALPIQPDAASVLLPQDWFNLSNDQQPTTNNLSDKSNNQRSTTNDDLTDSTRTPQSRISTTDPQKGISITAGSARASVFLTDSGMVLQAEQLPDSVHGTVDYTAPKVFVETTPAPEKPMHTFFRILGIIMFGGIILAVLAYALVKYLKH